MLIDSLGGVWPSRLNLLLNAAPLPILVLVADGLLPVDL